MLTENADLRSHTAGNVKRVFLKDKSSLHKWSLLKDNVDDCLNEMQKTIQDIVETAVQQCLNTVAAGREEISQLVEEQDDGGFAEVGETTHHEKPTRDDIPGEKEISRSA